VVTEQNELSNSIRELSKAVSFLLLEDKEQQYEKNPTNYQNQASNFQPMQQNIGNNTRLPFKLFINYTKQPNRPFTANLFGRHSQRTGNNICKLYRNNLRSKI
jgi:hypothetical protein